MVTGPYEKAKKYIETHQSFPKEQKEKAAGPCITLSRETGAGADVISEILCEKLQRINKNEKHKWAVFDKNLIEKIIEDNNFPQQIASFLEEGKRSEITSYISELLGLEPSNWVVLHKTAQTIMHLASIGNVIIVGRGGNVITAHMPSAIHIRFVAPVENRIKHVQDVFNLTYKQAVEHIKKDTDYRRTYLMKNYGKSIDDPYLYHMVINTNLLSYEEAAELIKDYMVKKFPASFRKEY